MSEMNLGEVVCKVNLKIKGISVDEKSGTVFISAIGTAGNKDTNSSGKLFSCITKISNSTELRKMEKKGAGFKLESDRFTLSIRPDQYFEILYRFDDMDDDLFGCIKQIVRDEVYKYFKINQENAINLKKQNQMLDNAAYEGAGENCVQDSYESAKILYSLSEGEEFTVEVEGRDAIKIDFISEPPKPILKIDNKPIALNGYRVKSIDFDLHQLTAVTDNERLKNIILSPEDFKLFYESYSSEFLSGSQDFNFLVKESVGRKFSLISYSESEYKQAELSV
ncbi:hypothetical protein [Marinomonas flavescens]|uniref:hypothetical protein n=1 Tax=Marinomonas flavescens TaxID=2529379 RepID=UPI001054A799|nr:hypothetical protein [Marinomonas flavescens]